MAATTTMNDFAKYYYYEEPPISEQTRALFAEYVGIEEEGAMVRHLKDVRDKAWDSFPYPCIGTFVFLDLTLQDLPVAEEVVRRMQTTTGDDDERFLDLGCCFGQDIRSLVFAGAPSARITGFDLRREFVEFGYELFRDRETLESEFVIGDFFDAECGLVQGWFDMIHASSFFHLFNWEEQVEAVGKAVRLLKPRRDSMIFGRQGGAQVAHSYPHPTSRSGEMYRHDEMSFQRLVEEVARLTGLELEGRSEVGGMEYEFLRREGFRMFTFSIRIVGVGK